jgi:hypothetical protein
LDAKYGLNIWMERPVTALLKDICAEPSPDLRRGFFDLTVYETSTGLPKDDNFRGIVEIKMGIKGYECLPDANRIRAIGKVCEPLCGIVAGMFIRDAKPVVDCMSESLQIEAREIVYRLASKPDIAGYSYGAVGALLQRSSPASTTLALWH